MNGKDFLSIADLTGEDIRRLVSSAVAMKSEGWTNRLSGKVIVLLFEKPSVRTRVSFDVAMRQLGGHCIYLSPEEHGLGKRESAPDAAQVLSRYTDIIVARTYSHETIEILARNSSVPVINALSDLEHPCQALADLLTIYEKKDRLEGISIAFIGDGNNVANSLLLGAALTGMNFRIASPSNYRIPDMIMDIAREYAVETGTAILCTEDPRQAVTGADIVYTDVWTSMGQEKEAEKRRRLFADYQVNDELLSLASNDVLLMHPLPAHHGEEIAENILYCPQSIVFDQAENRMHAQKALLVDILGGLEISLMNFQ